MSTGQRVAILCCWGSKGSGWLIRSVDARVGGR